MLPNKLEFMHEIAYWHDTDLVLFIHCNNLQFIGHKDNWATFSAKGCATNEVSVDETIIYISAGH
jgi:hypothetical protein